MYINFKSSQDSAIDWTRYWFIIDQTKEKHTEFISVYTKFDDMKGIMSRGLYHVQWL